jgi:hypothetical protein
MRNDARSKTSPLRRQKGWIGFVRSYKNYITNGSYDSIKWGDRTSEPKEVTRTEMGKEIQKW